MTYLFVDGYNIIGAWPELVTVRNENLEEARDQLISVLMEFAVVSGFKVVLVFDGWRVKGGQNVQVDNPYIDIHFSGEGVTADMLIERLVAQLPRHQVVYVATSDRLEQETILALGGLRISANELKRLILKERNGAGHHMQSKQMVANPLDARLDPEVREKLRRMILNNEEKE